MSWERDARAAAAIVLGEPPDALVLVSLGHREAREVYLAEAGARRVVAKCYPDAGRASVAGHTLELLGGRHGELIVPACLLIEEHVVVQDHLEGHAFIELLHGAGAATAAAAAGRAAATLHGLAAQLRDELPRAGAIARAEHAAGRLAGEDARLAVRALRAAESVLRDEQPLALVPAHGDLGPAQLIDCDGLVGIVDFDKGTRAEPALDVGNLLAQLARVHGADAPPLQAAMLEAYERASGTRLTRLARAYELLTFVRKLAHLEPARLPPVRSALERQLGSRPVQ